MIINFSFMTGTLSTCRRRPRSCQRRIASWGSCTRRSRRRWSRWSVRICSGNSRSGRTICSRFGRWLARPFRWASRRITWSLGSPTGTVSFTKCWSTSTSWVWTLWMRICPRSKWSWLSGRRYSSGRPSKRSRPSTTARWSGLFRYRTTSGAWMRPNGIWFFRRLLKGMRLVWWHASWGVKSSSRFSWAWRTCSRSTR